MLLIGQYKTKCKFSKKVLFFKPQRLHNNERTEWTYLFACLVGSYYLEPVHEIDMYVERE